MTATQVGAVVGGAVLALNAVLLYACLRVGGRADRWADDQRTAGDWDTALKALSRATMTSPDWAATRCHKCGGWVYRDRPCSTCAAAEQRGER